MTSYESEIKTIQRNQEEVFNTLSDLTNLQAYRNVSLPGEKNIDDYLKDVEISADEIQVEATGIGKIKFRVMEREPHKTIKFETVDSPVAANAWIQLLPVAENNTKMKITIRLKLPTMLKMMLDGKLKKGVNAIADAIAGALSNSSAES